MDKKLTDSEILKALPFLAKYCKDEYNGIRVDEVLLGAFDLINRLQTRVEKAEKVEYYADKTIATLQAENEDIKFLYENLKEEHLEIIKAIKHTKAEAYKEFAERLKEQKYQSSDWSHGEHPFVVEESDIDNTLYELVGEDK